MAQPKLRTKAPPTNGILLNGRRILAIVTGALAFATFVVAIVSVLGARDTAKLAEAAARQADISTQTLVMSQRPWLYIEGGIKAIGGWAFSADINNVGNAIATDVTINGKIGVQSIRGVPSTIETKSIPCGLSQGDFSGRVRKVAVLPKRDQDTAFIIAYAGGPRHLVRDRFSLPSLFVCIQYKWPFTDDMFHTYFSVGIEVIDPKTGQAFPFMQVPNNLGSVRTVGEISYLDAN